MVLEACGKLLLLLLLKHNKISGCNSRKTNVSSYNTDNLNPLQDKQHF